jgi:hypothetical protein
MNDHNKKLKQKRGEIKTILPVDRKLQRDAIDLVSSGKCAKHYM